MCSQTLVPSRAPNITTDSIPTSGQKACGITSVNGVVKSGASSAADPSPSSPSSPSLSDDAAHAPPTLLCTSTRTIAEKMNSPALQPLPSEKWATLCGVIRE